MSNTTKLVVKIESDDACMCGKNGKTEIDHLLTHIKLMIQNGYTRGEKHILLSPDCNQVGTWSCEIGEEDE